MKNKLLFIAFLVLISLSCKKEKPLPEEIPGVFPFEEVWSIKSEFHRCNAIEVTNHCLLYVYDNDFSRDALLGLDKLTGDTLWTRNLNYRSDFYKTDGELIFLESNGALLAIDAKTGADVWSYGGIGASKYVNQMTLDGNYIYAFFSIGNWTANIVEIYKIEKSTGIATQVFTLDALDFGGYRQIALESIHFTHPTSNNSMLYVQTTSFKSGNYGGNFYLLNLTADSMYWDLNPEINKIDTVGRGKGYSPIILPNQQSIIFNSQEKGTFSINYTTKTANWKNFETNFSRISKRMEYVDNNLFLFPSSNSPSIQVLNLATGNSTKNLGGDFAFSNSIVVKNEEQLYFLSGDLFIIDGNRSIIKGIDKGYKIGDSYGWFNNTVAIDNSSKHLYFTKGHGDFIVCYKIVEG